MPVTVENTRLYLSRFDAECVSVNYQPRSAYVGVPALTLERKARVPTCQL